MYKYIKTTQFIIILLLISKFGSSQFYIGINQGYGMPYKLKENSYKLYQKSDYYYFGEESNKTDTININFAEGMYYGVNFGYNFYKYFGVSIGYETMSSEFNPKFIEDKKYVTQEYSLYSFAYYSNNHQIYYNTIPDNTNITDTIYIRNKIKTIQDYILTSIKYYKLSLELHYPYKNIEIFGQIGFNYSIINLKQKEVLYSEWYTDNYSFRDTLGNFQLTNKYNILEEENSNIIKYNYKKTLNTNYTLGLRYNINNNISVLFKTNLNLNNYRLENKTSEMVWKMTGTKEDDYYVRTYTIETVNHIAYNNYGWIEVSQIKYASDKRFFYPTIRFDLGLRYTFGKK